MGAGGFGSALAAEPAPRATLPVAGAAFGAATAAGPARQPVPESRAAATALEILFKPRPAYTEEARRARVEGDVVLEVLFAGSGQPRILRVIRGLGYGLEQNAIDAAAKIRFRPAMEGGRAVDTVAVVRISFQIAY
jgi:TonB family protein